MGAVAQNTPAGLGGWAFRVCLDAGLRIPEDIGFVGFDDIPLTTLRVDKQELGRTGVEMLVGGGAMPQEMVMGVELMVRESSGVGVGAG